MAIGSELCFSKKNSVLVTDTEKITSSLKEFTKAGMNIVGYVIEGNLVNDSDEFGRIIGKALTSPNRMSTARALISIGVAKASFNNSEEDVDIICRFCDGVMESLKRAGIIDADGVFIQPKKEAGKILPMDRAEKAEKAEPVENNDVTSETVPVKEEKKEEAVGKIPAEIPTVKEETVVVENIDKNSSDEACKENEPVKNTEVTPAVVEPEENASESEVRDESEHDVSPDTNTNEEPVEVAAKTEEVVVKEKKRRGRPPKAKNTDAGVVEKPVTEKKPVKDTPVKKTPDVKSADVKSTSVKSAREVRFTKGPAALSSPDEVKGRVPAECIVDSDKVFVKSGSNPRISTAALEIASKMFYEGKSAREVAKALGLNNGAVLAGVFGERFINERTDKYVVFGGFYDGLMFTGHHWEKTREVVEKVRSAVKCGLLSYDDMRRHLSIDGEPLAKYAAGRIFDEIKVKDENGEETTIFFKDKEGHGAIATLYVDEFKDALGDSLSKDELKKVELIADELLAVPLENIRDDADGIILQKAIVNSGIARQDSRVYERLLPVYERERKILNAPIGRAEGPAPFSRK